MQVGRVGFRPHESSRLSMPLIFADKTDRCFLVVLAIHFLVRLGIALSLDLGVDEAYYVFYGQYPQWSYFDHPPMVGWLVWLTTMGLSNPSVFFVRLGPLLINTLVLVVTYRIGVLLKDRKAALIIVCLVAASFYNSVISGVFLLPDAPLVLFWMLAIWAFLSYIKTEQDHFLWLHGCFSGMAMLCKYQSAFLVLGALVWLLKYKPGKLPLRWFIPSLVVPAIVFLPVLLWNVRHGMVSYDLHSSRIGNADLAVKWHFLLSELAGQWFYNNPVVVVLVATSLWRPSRFKHAAARMPYASYLLAVSVPLIALTIGLSFFNKTLPHWSGPAYYALILCAVCFGPTVQARSLRRWVRCSLAFFLAVAGFGLLQIHTGLLKIGDGRADAHRLGSGDFTLDVYGWPQIRDRFDELVVEDVRQGRIDTNYVIIVGNWFPGAQIDYYLALTRGRTLFVYGDIRRQHQYRYINPYRGGFSTQRDAYYLTTSRYFFPPDRSLVSQYARVEEVEPIPVHRQGEVVYYLYVYRMRKRG